MSIAKVCVRSVDLADLDDNIWKCAERMHQRGVGALVVINSEKVPIGILTDRDIVERVVAVGRDPLATPVGEVMTLAPAVVREDASINLVIDQMRTHGVRRLPVVDDDDRLQGLITLDDLIMLLAEELTTIGKLVQRQTPQVAVGGVE